MPANVSFYGFTPGVPISGAERVDLPAAGCLSATFETVFARRYRIEVVPGVRNAPAGGGGGGGGPTAVTNLTYGFAVAGAYRGAAVAACVKPLVRR
jgi:hypothetical protein